MPGLRFGLVLGTRRLAASIGTFNARKLLEASQTLDAQEALKLGVATDISQEEYWSEIVNEATNEACALPNSSHRIMLQRTGAGSIEDDTDMAVLVGSAAVPGLKERIVRFIGKNK